LKKSEATKIINNHLRDLVNNHQMGNLKDTRKVAKAILEDLLAYGLKPRRTVPANIALDIDAHVKFNENGSEFEYVKYSYTWEENDK